MAATERTLLTRSSQEPSYVEFPGIVRPRRLTNIRQFQCCVCAILLSIFVMTLVATISFSMKGANEQNNLTTQENSTVTTLKSTWSTPSSKTDEIQPLSQALSFEEQTEAITAGVEAMEARRLADTSTRHLPSPSANSRHQYAVRTSVYAGKLAMAGVGEIAATKRIESVRTTQGKPTSVGSYFDAGWAPAGACKEFANLDCSLNKYRTYDGTCNHPKQFGSSLSAFLRVVPPDYADGVDAPRKGMFGAPLPSARQVSLQVHPPSPSSNPGFTVMLAVFGQFLDHDITSTAVSQGINGSSLACCPPYTSHPECFPVYVGPGDPVYDVSGSSCMEFVRSAPAPQCKIGPRQQFNQVSAFIDGSTIYGSDFYSANNIREGIGGLLKMQLTPDNRTLLPPSTDPNDGCNRDLERWRGRYCFAAGDGRANENLHLTTMHLLWARQHNRVASNLEKLNPHWDDEKLYQESRRIIGAQMQHIAYNEFVPIVLGEKEITQRNLKPLSSGYRTPDTSDVNPAIANNFATAAFRFAHTLLPGLMRVTDVQKGTAEYVELHKMLFNPYSLYTQGGMESSLMTAMYNTVQKTSTHVTSQLTNHLFEDPLANSTVPCGLDLVSLNIQRGRDHGLPGYPIWREHCGLGRPTSFSDLNGELDPDALEAISKIYNNVDDVDLYTGALAEIVKSDGIIGPTFTCLIADQFRRLQSGDRYWYETSETPQAFTEGQLTEIRRSSLAKFICDCSDNITHVQAEVMRSVSDDNPIVSCEDIPGLSLATWKEDPPITLKESTGPLSLTRLKEEINETIQDAISYLNSKKPPVESEGLNGIRNYVNDSFADFRSELSTAVHPVLPGTSKYNELTCYVDNSLKKLNSYVLKRSTEFAAPDDCIVFRNKIKEELIDTVEAAKVGAPSVADWIAFKERIKSEFADMKSQIIAMNKEASGSKISNTSVLEFSVLKDDIITLMNGAIERVKDNVPPPGSPNRGAYLNNVKMQFSSIKDYIPLSKEEFLARETKIDGPTAADKWNDFRSNIVNTLDETILSTKDEMPPPGDPKWTSFGGKMKDLFTDFRNQVAAKRPIEATIPSWTSPSDFVQFRIGIVKNMNDAVGKMKDNMPPPGSPEWVSYRNAVVSAFAMTKYQIPVTNMGKVLKSSAAVDDFDWVSIKNEINKTVSDAIAECESGTSSLDGLKWLEIKDHLNKSFNALHNDIASLKPKPYLKESPKLTVSDWTDFKSQINQLLKNVTDYVEVHKPLKEATVEDWVALKNDLKNQFATIKYKIIDIKLKNLTASLKTGDESECANEFYADQSLPTSEEILKLKKVTQKDFDIVQKNILKIPLVETTPGLNKTDWIAFKIQIKNSIRDLIKSYNYSDPTSWYEIQDFYKKSFAEIKNEIDAMKNSTKSDDVEANGSTNTVYANYKSNLQSVFKNSADPSGWIKLKSSAPAIPESDWISIKGKLNNSIYDFFNSVNRSDPTAWVKIKNYFNTSFADIINQINTLKNSTKSDNTATIDLGLTDVPFLSSSAKAGSTFDWTKFKKDSKSIPVIPGADWIAFRDKLNSSVNSFINSVNRSDPTTWIQIKDYFNTSFADVISQIDALKNASKSDKTSADDSVDPINSLLLSSSAKAGGTFDWTKFKKNPKLTPVNPAVDWIAFRDKLNDSINNFVNSVNRSDPTAWIQIKNYFQTSFGDIISQINALRNSTKSDNTATNDSIGSTDSLRLFSTTKFTKGPKSTPVTPGTDWIAFRDKLNGSINNFVNSVNRSDPAAWTQIRDFFKTSFADVINQINDIKNCTKNGVATNNLSNYAETTSNLKYSPPFTESVSTFNWQEYQAKINETIYDMLKNLSNIEESQKMETEALQQILVDTHKKFADLNIDSLQNTIPDPPSNWVTYVNGINKTVNDAIHQIKAIKLTATDTALDEYKQYVDGYFNETRDIIKNKENEISTSSAWTLRPLLFSHFYSICGTIFFTFIICTQ
ncbi:uncharacterized protein LOC105700025 isoform X2 [Orussus abietinus]|uniref:uncharacterized protein LOC105700025 isoform X2 n=1 Tax=Orussus abietinus TaxID=222816 RepID=UPI0006269801|nr:uncharacterized protein LOC105700025 isoform X2 [Orussus abietinus]